MGRHAKPEHEKELNGAYKKNAQRRPTDTPPPVFGNSKNNASAAGAPPEHLTEKEAEAWNEILLQTFPGVVGISDRLALEVMAKLVAEMREGWHEMTAAKLSRLETMLARFGMTPADRQRISVKAEKPKNKFSDLDS